MSTEEYDRGEKLRQYKPLPSLWEILIVSLREPRLTLHRRDDSDWVVTDAYKHEAVALIGIAALCG